MRSFGQAIPCDYVPKPLMFLTHLPKNAFFQLSSPMNFIFSLKPHCAHCKCTSLLRTEYLDNTGARQKTAHGQNVLLRTVLLREWAGAAHLKSSMGVLGSKECACGQLPPTPNPGRQPRRQRGGIRRPCRHGGELTTIWAAMTGGMVR